ncbi:MAG: hypothetical protein Q9219_007313 [cf. Caloplaca sp. 3 TL-2023]
MVSPRVDSALKNLIDALITESANEDRASLDERRDDARALATNILDGLVNCWQIAWLDSKILLDIQGIRLSQISIGTGGTEEVSRLSALVSRLQEQPILVKKSAILLLFHHLADEHPIDLGSLKLNGSRPEEKSLYSNKNRDYRENSQPRAYTDAPLSNGLRPPLSHENLALRGSGTGGNGVRGHRSRKEATAESSEDQQEDEFDVSTNSKPTEALLLHDLPFTLQGLSSTYLPFSSRTTLDLPRNLPLPIISLLHTLAEPSLLYRVLSDFVDSRDEGLVSQSLRSAIGRELRSYLGLIATLEGEIRRAIASAKSEGPHGGIGKAGVTLKRCIVWTREATMGLRLMSSMAEEAKSTWIKAFAFSY